MYNHLILLLLYIMFKFSLIELKLYIYMWNTELEAILKSLLYFKSLLI